MILFDKHIITSAEIKLFNLNGHRALIRTCGPCRGSRDYYYRTSKRIILIKYLKPFFKEGLYYPPIGQIIGIDFRMKIL